AGSIGSFTGLYAQLQEAIGASKRIFELLDERPTIGSLMAPQVSELGDVSGRIDFERVSFRYDGRGDEAVLDDITLSAKPGEMVAIVGPSGAGKSTLVSLIPRFYDPTAGSVQLDGLDIRSIDVAELRSHIG